MAHGGVTRLRFTMATTTTTTPNLITRHSTRWRPTIFPVTIQALQPTAFFPVTIQALQPTAFGAGAAGRGSQLVVAPAILKENSLALVSETHRACLSALARGELSAVNTYPARDEATLVLFLGRR